MKKILLVNPFGIGDVLFTTAVIRAIKDAYPDSFIGYWCNQRVSELLEINPAVNVVFPLSRGDLKKIFRQSKFSGMGKFFSLFYGIKRQKFDILLDFSLEHRYSLMAKLLGIRQRIGFNYKGRGRFLTEKISLEGYKGRHVVEYYLDLLQFLYIKAEGGKLELPLSQESRIKARNLFLSFGIKPADTVVGIVPGAGASWGRDAGMKHWPAIRFTRLADRIADELGAKIVILGDEKDRPLADTIAGMMKHRPVDLIAKTSLEETAAVMSELKLSVTNDGGPLHMAVAVGAKTVSIFGPVDENVYGPYPKSQWHEVITRQMPCRPCYQNFRLPLCENGRACIEEITVEEVFAAVRRLL
ncbi:MAG: glycosyltransferase family 9 protein [Candidatus Omnitrophota bacterium]|nr:glycosyltransferase family 9 protein [Candidatus Omnitrophota bacterium]